MASNIRNSIFLLVGRYSLDDEERILLYLENNIKFFEKDICSVLSRLAHHVHPDVVSYIQKRNIEERPYFEKIFRNRINIDHYFFDGSACVFPGVHRYVSGQGKVRSYNESYRAIIDSNEFPRHMWCFLKNGTAYSGPKWKSTGLAEFELAHIFSHKESDIQERSYFEEFPEDHVTYSDFSCACNVVLLPKGTVRPTDNSIKIKAAFYRRYIELYGEAPLGKRRGFKWELVPDWYSELVWNEPILPHNWEERVERLMAYRTKRLGGIMDTGPSSLQ